MYIIIIIIIINIIFQAPSITHISQTSTSGGFVTITGTNFGTDASVISLSFLPSTIKCEVIRIVVEHTKFDCFLSAGMGIGFSAKLYLVYFLYYFLLYYLVCCLHFFFFWERFKICRWSGHNCFCVTLFGLVYCFVFYFCLFIYICFSFIFYFFTHFWCSPNCFKSKSSASIRWHHGYYRNWFWRDCKWYCCFPRRYS